MACPVAPSHPSHAVGCAAALAPGAAINLYASDSSITTSGIVNAMLYAVDDDTADILSLSYGNCEQNLGVAGNAFINAMWQQASAQGQTVFVSAGDAGSAACDNFEFSQQASGGLAVNGFASTPYNTAVGGTDFYYPDYAQGINGSGLQAELAAAWGTSSNTFNPGTTLIAPIEEQAWNDGFGLDIGGNPGYTIVGGGGASSCIQGSNPDPVTGVFGTCTAGYPKPSWQVGAGVPADGVRDLPDVSLFAADGANNSFWPICASALDCQSAPEGSPAGSSIQVTGVGGTSASSPAMAGIMALLVQAQKGRQGNINPTLYALATQFPNTFNDISLGSNNVPCNQATPNCSLDTNNDGFYSLQHYDAGIGYDQASGLGSANGANLLANWASVSGAGTATKTALILSQSTFTHGTPFNVIAAVTSTGGGAPAGQVALLANLPAAIGQGDISITAGTGSAIINSLPGGTYTLTGEYTSSSGSYAASTSSPVSVTVSPEPSTATLTGEYEDQNYRTDPLINGVSTRYGDQYAIDVAILGKSGNGAATGVVTLMDGSTALATANVSQSSVAAFNFGNLVPGTHTLSATYSGDPSFKASVSAPMTVTVVKGSPGFYYDGASGSYGTPVIAGQPLPMTFSLYPVGYFAAPPTGTITVTLGSLPSQTAPLQAVYFGATQGFASVTLTPNAPGTYPVTAVYSGDSNFAPVNALTYSATVTVAAPASTLAATTTSMTSNETAAGPASITEFHVQVIGSKPGVVPTGYVDFQLSEGFSFQFPVDPTGKSVLTIGGLPTGVTVVYAEYTGDSNFAGSQSSSITVTGNQGDFGLIAAQSAFSIPAGSTASTSLSVLSNVANGNLDGLSGSVALSCTTNSPSMTCSLTPASLTLAANGTPSTTQLIINTSTTTTKALNQTPGKGFRRLSAGTLSLAMLLVFAPRRKRLNQTLICLFFLGCGLLAFGPLGCGGSKAAAGPTTITTLAPAGSYEVNILATSNGIEHSLTLRVLVQ